MPVSTVFENIESGASIEEIAEWFHITREQIVTVIEFAARSLDPPAPTQTPSTNGRCSFSLIKAPPPLCAFTLRVITSLSRGNEGGIV